MMFPKLAENFNVIDVHIVGLMLHWGDIGRNNLKQVNAACSRRTQIPAWCYWDITHYILNNVLHESKEGASL